jgi:hypothetical protein
MGIVKGSNINAVASPTKATLASNFIDHINSDFTQQYLPELIAEEAEVFGNRSVAGFLSLVGAEEPMASDSVVWSEQGRLHLSYTAIQTADGSFTVVGTGDYSGTGSTAVAHGVRVGDTIVVTDGDATVKAYVDVADQTAGTFEAHPFEFADFANATNNVLTTSSDTGAAATAADYVKVFVYGSMYQKGTTGRGEGLNPSFKSFSNTPIILKDKFEVSGSDASQIGWVEVSGEEGQSGYLWYLKAEGDTRRRFMDYCEMSMVEAVKKGASAVAAVPYGSEGLFAAIEDRGIVASSMLDNGTTADLADFDTILKELDKQGAIEENMLYLNRDTALNVDDMLASINGYAGTGSAANAASFGVFENNADMALNLGFSGFRRGSYDFYKSDWKYLNDGATYGAMTDTTASASDTLGDGKVNGVLIPAGVSSVYDQQLGRNLKRPFLHVRYRASQTESRLMKTWVTGSVGAATSDLDAMEVNYLSERCLVVQGANNFVLFRK